MAKRQKKTKVLIVDDHPIVREGLRRLINREDTLRVCGEAEDVQEGLNMLEQKKPDVVVVDISMKGRNGLELVRHVSDEHPDLPVLVLSVHDESVYAERVLQAGARGYVMKKEAAEEVVDAIHRVLSGEIYLSNNMTSKVLHRLTKGKPLSPFQTLTNRELHVLELIGRGLTVSQIARKLKVGQNTVATYRTKIKQKLQIKGRNELLPYAIQWVKTEESIENPVAE